MSAKNHMAVRIEGDVLVLVHDQHPPTDAEWDELYVSVYRNMPATPHRFQLVFTSGGGPNAAQRKRAAEEGERAFAQRGLPIPRTAVMTGSAPMRGLVTVFNWIFPGRYGAFDPENFRGALEYVERRPEDHERFRALVEAMRRDLAP